MTVRRFGLLVRAGERGQAAVETVAMLPVLGLVALAAGQALAAGAASELAGHAAEAGAVAIFEGEDPVSAARASIPGWSRDRVAVSVRDGQVAVSLVPPALHPSLARLLTAHAEASASR